ncbi:MAG: undecaprenyl-diphosphate phosphatase [Butyrivibrio sp.]|nr:undecaprenyl-diphosphate phosphatase [Butyrivibrio sp.]
MNILKALFMGLIQGFTEFLPVSSSGHLAIFRYVFKLELDSGNYFDVLLHMGTLAAVIVVFREDIWGMLREFWGILMTVFANLLIFIKRKKGDNRYTYFKVINSSYRKLVIMVLISSVPTGILGIAGNELAEMASGRLWIVGICLVLTAVLLFLADRHSNGKVRIKDAQYSSAFIMGIAQGVATMPGLSRSGTTICTGLMLGFNKKLAVKYSFIMSIPAIIGAMLVKIGGLKDEAFGSANLPGYILGTLAAFGVGLVSLKLMLKLIRNKKYIGFAVYCLVIGLVAIVYSAITR